MRPALNDVMTGSAPQNDIVIEPLTREVDLDLVVSLEARCFTNPWSRDVLARQLAESQTTRIFLLRLPEAPVAAFCSCWFLFDELHVNTLVVDFPFRRQGFGRLLVHHVLVDAARQGSGGQRWRCGNPMSPRGASTSASGSRSRRSGRSTTRSQRRMR